MTRSDRTYSWTDPSELADLVREMTAEAFLEACTRGDVVPPMAATLDFRLLSFETGRVELVCAAQDFHYNPYGLVHGGLAAALLDTAAGGAVQTGAIPGTAYATSNLSVSYIRPIFRELGTLHCVGDLVSLGSRTAVATSELLDSAGRLLAVATVNFVIEDSD